GPFLHDRDRCRHRQPAGRDPRRPRPGRGRTICGLHRRRPAADRLRVLCPGRDPGVPQLAAQPPAPSSRVSLVRNKGVLTVAVLALTIAAPFILPAFQVELTFLWIMIVFALSWDVMGGQAGYNSFGNIAFFGIGVYTAAVTQIGLFHD